MKYVLARGTITKSKTHLFYVSKDGRITEELKEAMTFNTPQEATNIIEFKIGYGVFRVDD